MIIHQFPRKFKRVFDALKIFHILKTFSSNDNFPLFLLTTVTNGDDCHESEGGEGSEGAAHFILFPISDTNIPSRVHLLCWGQWVGRSVRKS